MPARFVVVDADPEERIALDASQAAVLAVPDGASAAVLGAPGSGKTTTIIELVADRIARGWRSDEVLVLAPSRASATRLRDRIARRIGIPTDGPLARTAASLSFEIVGAAARAAGRPAPRLLTATEQDADLAAILAGHLADGTGPAWPDPLTPEVRALRGFRAELREFLARATEYGADAVRVAQLARETGRDDWLAAAQFMREYAALQAQNRLDQLDAAELVSFAVRAIREGWEGDRISRLRLVVVDDLQEATESTMSILRALADRGVAVIAFGDPDVAANAFRGGEADAVSRFAAELRLGAGDRLVLSSVYRGSPALRGLVSRTVERIGTAAAGPQRRAVAVAASVPADPERPPISAVIAPTPSRQAAGIARVLREEHLLHGVGWSQLVVVVRSGAQIPELARALARAEVPTRTTGRGTPLRDDPAPRALLTLVEVGIGRRPLDAQTAAELLVGPFGGLDPVGLRRLRLALRHEELAGGGIRAGAELVAEALAAPGRLATIEGRAARRAARLAETLEALRGVAERATIEELLWTAWDRSGVADRWRRSALGSGIEAAEANRDLDGVVALFAAAQRFVEQRPTEGALEFLEHVLDADISDDLLAPPRADDAVLVATPSALVGREFRTVVVASLQDGAWPNLRPRGSLLAPQRLVRVLEGRDTSSIDERKLVLDDELRMFALAVSRASERVVLAAVDNEDDARSVLFSLAPDGATGSPSSKDGSVARLPRHPLTLRGLTGLLRRELIPPAGERVASAEDERRRADAAALLARLAAEGVIGADPSEWLGLLEPSSDAPLFAGEPVRVSPSQLAKVEESPLDWAVSKLAGGGSSIAASIGTIVHWAMETAESPDVDALWAQVETRWPELPFEAAWLAEAERRATRRLVRGLSEYLVDFAAAGKTLVGAEKRFRLAIADGVVISGSIDRVELGPDGEVVIVDLKTGSPETNKEVIAAHPQLATYQLAYHEGVLDEALATHGEHRAGGAKLLFVKSGIGGKLYREGVQFVLDEEALAGFREDILRAARLMGAARFTGPLEATGRGGGAPDFAARLPRAPEVTHD